MESTPPTTITQLYTTFTSKLLKQHFSSCETHGKQSWKVRSLEDLPPDVNQQLQALSKLAWEGILKQQLTFSSADINGSTLGLMESVKELYHGQDAELSYHFIHLTLQEFLAAYHITQLPFHTQQKIIKECNDIRHLNMTMKFYFGLSKCNNFTSNIINKHLSIARSPAVYQWLYEMSDVEEITNLLASGSGESLVIISSYGWSPLDYYVLGHAISCSQFKWKLHFVSSFMGKEGFEMLSRGLMTMGTRPWKGEITYANFSYNNIHADCFEYFLNIPPPILVHYIGFQ